MRKPTSLLLALAACVAVGCGADEETKPSIPQTASTDLQARLAEVQRRVDAGGGACRDIVLDTEPAVHRILAGLPSSVDPDVRDALGESFDHLFDLTDEQCDEGKGEQTDTNTDTPTTTETTTTTTETDTTESTATEPPDTGSTGTTPPDTQPTDTGQQPSTTGGGGTQGPGL